MLFKNLKIKYKLFIMTIIPIAGLIYFSYLQISGNYQEFKLFQTNLKHIEIFTKNSDLIQELQKERGKTNLYLNRGILFNELKKQRDLTNQVFVALKESLKNNDSALKIKERTDLSAYQTDNIRTQIERRALFAGSFEQYSEIINNLFKTFSEITNSKTTRGIGKKFASLSLLEDSKEQAAKLRGFLSGILAADKPISTENLLRILTYKKGLEANLYSPAVLLSENSQKLLRQIELSAEWKETNAVFLKVVQSFQKGRYQVSGADYFKKMTHIVDNIGNLIDTEKRELKSFTEDIRNEIAGQMITYILINLLILFISTIIAILMIRAIIKPVFTMTAQLKAISEGQSGLNVKLVIDSHDEIGLLSKYLNQFIGNLKELVIKIIESNYQVLTAVEEVSKGNQDMAPRVDSQSASLEETASAIEQMTANIKNSTNNAVIARKLANETKSSAIEGESVLSNAVESIEKTTVQASKIKDIIKIIEEIAFQTNILALNAAVEAARAKENGKGFAVVANEVRSLAQKTFENAKQIAEVIENLVKGIVQGNQLAKQTQSKFIEIKDKIEVAVDKINEVAAGAEEQSTGIDQINQAVNHLDESTQANASLVEEVASSAEELETQARDVIELLKNFKVNEIAESKKFLATKNKPSKTEKKVTKPIRPVQKNITTPSMEKKTTPKIEEKTFPQKNEKSHPLSNEGFIEF